LADARSGVAAGRAVPTGVRILVFDTAWPAGVAGAVVEPAVGVGAEVAELAVPLTLGPLPDASPAGGDSPDENCRRPVVGGAARIDQSSSQISATCRPWSATETTCISSLAPTRICGSVQQTPLSGSINPDKSRSESRTRSFPGSSAASVRSSTTDTTRAALSPPVWPEATLGVRAATRAQIHRAGTKPDRGGRSVKIVMNAPRRDGRECKASQPGSEWAP